MCVDEQRDDRQRRFELFGLRRRVAIDVADQVSESVVDTVEQ